MAVESNPFAQPASGYATHRPGYPEALFDWLRAQTATHALAWDAGCGTGQASVALARRYARVHATDPSAAQIERATRVANIDYRVGAAERCELPDSCADLVTVATAAHWFDWPRFAAQTRRVLKPGGVLAIWGYHHSHIDAAVDPLVRHFAMHTLMPWWDPRIHRLWSGYAECDCAWGTPLEAPSLAIEQHADLDTFATYLRTWSAVAACEASTGEDAVASLLPDLRAAWGDPQQPRRIVRPLSLRAWRA